MEICFANRYAKKKINFNYKILRLLVILVIMLNIFIFLPENTEAQQRIHVLVTFDASIKSANVKPGENLPVVFFCNVSVAKKYFATRLQMVEVGLVVEFPGEGWSATFSTPNIILSQGQNIQKIELIVLPPMQEKHLTMKQINVTGKWWLRPSAGEFPTAFGDIEPGQVSVVVSQFYRFTLYEEPPLKLVWPGDTVEFDLVIYNQGNGLDAFDLTVSNDDALIKAGYAVELNRTSIDVPSKSEGKIQVTVHGVKPIFAPWKIANTAINIKVESQNAKRHNQNITREATFYYYENGPYVSEPFWFLIIVLIIIIVFFFYRYNKKTKKWLEERKSRKKKKEKDE